MDNRSPKIHWPMLLLALCILLQPALAQQASTTPSKIYVPYENLRDVFESQKQGVFLPYQEFQRLWQAATGAPAAVQAAPTPYLISTARVAGKVSEEVATMQLELTVDILLDGWVEVPIGLGDVAVVKASFVDDQTAGPRPLLRVIDKQYKLITRGKGRRVLKVDFVRQLLSKPGLKVLSYNMPSAAISTLELLIPAENMKVDVEPMLAATTTQVDLQGEKAAKLQAFLGSAKKVKLSWKPKTQAAADLEPVIIATQLQHIHVAEALVSHDVDFTFDIRRRPVDSFAVELPPDFRVTSVDAANVSKWDIVANPPSASSPMQLLQVKLFAPAKDAYSLKVKMERFLKESKAQIPLRPIIVRNTLRQTGLIAISHSPRRSVELRESKNLARVDIGRLPTHLSKRAGLIAYRFITSDYGGSLAITSVDPRITVNQLWALGVNTDRLELKGQLNYKIERAGLFQLTMNLPEPWEITSLGPSKLVDDHQLTGQGSDRKLTILLNRELSGSFQLQLVARAKRDQPQADVNFVLPLADPQNVHLYSGQLLLYLPEQLQAQVQQLNQLHSLPVKRAGRWTSFSGLKEAMAFEFRAIDRAKPAGASLKIALKPTQISALVHRLVNIQPGSIDQEAVIEYRIRYAPVDTLYLKMPAALADAGVQISGSDIKEKPRIEQLPADQLVNAQPATEADTDTSAKGWAYYKIVLQFPKIGTYRLRVQLRRSFQAGQIGQATTVTVEPILAAGKLLGQSGHIAITKADTLAIGQPISENLIPAEAGSAADLPYQPHRKIAFLAFKYTAPPFELSLPVVTQAEAAVYTTIANAAIVEQVLARDGTLNAHVIYLLATSRGDRLPISIPDGAKLFAVLLNGSEVPVEMGTSPDQRIVRLPPSAGQVSKFVVEISYGLAQASARKLSAPTLPKDIPVQQCLWRLWVPQDDYVLAYDRDFSPLHASQANRMLTVLAQNYPSGVSFKLAPQGQQLNFVRQGPPAKLSVTLADKEVFTIVLWLAIFAAGAWMLKLDAFRRCLIILAAAAVAFIIRLFAPLLIDRVFATGTPAAVIVVGLWLVYWFFIKHRRQMPPAEPTKPHPEPSPQAPDEKNQPAEEA